MASSIHYFVITALLATSVTSATVQKSGSGTTTRYWDCCKPSCAWNILETLGIQSAVKTCDANDQPLTDTSLVSGCDGGPAYMCSDQSPWAVSSNLAYGFAAISVSNPSCCQCYQLTFTSGTISGKRMIVQATNTGADLSATQFDIAIPGAGYGIFDGCTKEWGATPSIWGAQYGGSSTNTCSSFPTTLQPGCSFRWDWFEGTDNPTVDWEEVSCPVEITAKSGCIKIGDTPTDSQPLLPITGVSSTTAAETSSSAITTSNVLTSSSEPATLLSATTYSSSLLSSDIPFPTLSISSTASTSALISAIEATSVTAASNHAYSISATDASSAPEPTDLDDDNACEL